MNKKLHLTIGILFFIVGVCVLSWWIKVCIDLGFAIYDVPDNAAITGYRGRDNWTFVGWLFGVGLLAIISGVSHIKKFFHSELL